MRLTRRQPPPRTTSCPVTKQSKLRNSGRNWQTARPGTVTSVRVSALPSTSFAYPLGIVTAILKKQAAQNAEEYDRLATKFNEATGQTSNKKTD
ncbi:hypothetical protein J3R82DRAFT_9013 [Butyriboletus roseoflavus]|nr:hypothetical protein J3R82DRAFT_9013 [Butyriboletus roseoflavus]